MLGGTHLFRRPRIECLERRPLAKVVVRLLQERVYALSLAVIVRPMTNAHLEVLHA